MPATLAFETPSPFAAAIRAAGLALLAVAAALAFAFAAAAAAIIGLLVMGAAVMLRLMPRRRAVPVRADVLEAHRTPSGWVVETRAKR